MKKQSTYLEKAVAGVVPSAQDWEDLLKMAHKEAPSMTPKAFAVHLTAQGMSSYQILTQTLLHISSQEMRVLDLACGDGHMIHEVLKVAGNRVQVAGLDMSEGELAVARKNFSQHSQVSLLNGRAQAMPFASGSFDAILCHMAFMLMTPVEAVIQEVLRVLKPQGVFSAVVGWTDPKSSMGQEVMAVIGEFFKKNFPHLPPKLPTGDVRVRSHEGIQELFSENKGFASDLKIHDFHISVNVNEEDFWAFYGDTYLVGMLLEEHREHVKKDLLQLFHRRKGDNGLVTFEFPLRQITVSKA